MKKATIILVLLAVLSIAGIFILSKSPRQKTAETAVDYASPRKAAVKGEASVSVGHIDFKAAVLTENNFDAWNAEFGGKLDKSALNSSTRVILILNNHRDDLSAFDYGKLSFLDGKAAQNWEQMDERMGGHHVNGVLTFPKTENPRSLVIKGLPVGEAVLTF